MKKLIFVRHGRAEDPGVEFSDFERSLTSKGKNISKLMARKLIETEDNIGQVITSPAFRALETALIFAGEFRFGLEKIIMVSNLYYKMSFRNFNEVLSMIDDETDTVVLFGHNPSFSEITNTLCISGCDFMPKCGIVCISFDKKKWTDITANTGRLEYFLKPEKAL